VSVVGHHLVGQQPRGVFGQRLVQDGFEGGVVGVFFEERLPGDGPKGNIGFPSEPDGIAQFRKMLLATRRNLTDAEIRSLLRALEDRKSFGV
jgi:hypothetical protein